jgi:hypothetical protein
LFYVAISTVSPKPTKGHTLLNRRPPKSINTDRRYIRFLSQDARITVERREIGELMDIGVK